MQQKSIFIIISLLISFSCYSQNRHELGIGYEIASQENQNNFSYGYNLRYTRWLNKNIGLQAGFRTYKHLIDISFNNPFNNNIDYNFYEYRRREYQANLGFVVSSSRNNRIGVMLETSFLFNLFPYENIEYTIDSEEQIGDTYTRESYDDDKWVFNRFNPSFSFEFSIFVKKKKSPLRLNFGIGLNNQNPLIAYYRAEIDGFKLKDHLDLSFEKLNVVLFIRFSAYLNKQKDKDEYL
ncbi:hypothetical protein E0494_00790 [Marinilabiliaceae bacterium JC040]|nr:hypothetical protein [Marinilabiliaceae bacterium JC040]